MSKRVKKEVCVKAEVLADTAVAFLADTAKFAYSKRLKKEADFEAGAASKSLRPLVKVERQLCDTIPQSTCDIKVKREKPDGAEVEICEKPAKKMNMKKTESETAKAQEPPNWRELLGKVETMRSTTLAPVDTVGCCSLADSPNPRIYRLEVLMAAFLSSQTKDAVTAAAMAKLKQHGLSVENILRTPEEQISQLIFPVGFYKTKAKNMKRICEILARDFGGDVPVDLDVLMGLPGVGPKMSHLFINVVSGEAQGICVDTHVHRICNRFKWVNTAGKKEDDTRVALQSWLPKEHWISINKLLVGFGQTICLPQRPLCDSCLASTICPSAFKTHLEASRKGKK